MRGLHVFNKELLIARFYQNRNFFITSKILQSVPYLSGY